MSQKTLGQRVSVSLAGETHKKLSDIAAKNGVSVSWVMRYAVANFLREWEKEGNQQLVFPFTNSNTER